MPLLVDTKLLSQILATMLLYSVFIILYHISPPKLYNAN
ncbi:hypothetical protein FOPG_19314 [Fusarium oxysporum f. sp. conglutinans race 2 54008]|uniref:Uncharacterized protein n=1 Tax=Fusarium oxysporum f. sp. conglutinans race 2 54008 TaxID=1089457 RepID=X0GX64_FUSOX|nr:hypothetical protein FOPG_19314 [Fusarium oxysporum f. sp. conglutinans race 2 54008]